MSDTINNTKMITGKLSRTLKTTAMAAQSGAKHLKFLGQKNFSSDPESLQKKHEEDIGKLLFQGLSQMRGTALKASQLLSLEADLIPEGIRKELAKSCHQVPPINRALIRKVFMQEFGMEPKKLFKNFSPTAFAAASLGQVHLAELENGSQVAVKIQYPGIRESIDSDLKILSFIMHGLAKTTKMLPKKSVINETLDEIKLCLADEVDYEKEAKNTLWFKENLNVDKVKIPNVVEDFTTKRVITTELLPGIHLEEWLKSNPTQQQRNKVGQTIFNVFLSCVFHLKALHADPHFGNYLFMENDSIGLLDFGCVRFINGDFPSEMAALVNYILNQDMEGIFGAYKVLDLFDTDLPFETYQKEIHPVLSPIQDWIAKPYQSAYFDFSTLPPPPITDYNQHHKAIQHLNGLKRDQIYFDRTYFGVYQLLKRMKAVVKTENPWFTPNAILQ